MAKKILIVDDDEDFLQTLTIFLESSGYQIITAESGEPAISEYTKNKPNLILMDVVMPGVCGCDAARKIKEIDKDAKVVLMSVKENPECKINSNSHTFDFLQKPFSIGFLTKKVSQYLTS